MRKAALLLTAALIGLTPAFAHAQQASTFSDAQKTEIESIIKDYLTNKHPEVMAAGLQNLQQKEQEESDSKTHDAINKMKDKMFNDPMTPVGGNPKGDVTVVEFFDYQCGYCKMSEAGVAKLLSTDKNVRFIYKEFPILGAVSVEAAHAALASVKQGKYQAFHDAMMNKHDHLTSAMIYDVAQSIGIDTDRLKKDMTAADVDNEVKATLKLGEDIGVRGTPMFLVNDTIFPGAVQGDQLGKAVNDARSGKKS